jgi:hypothetical protein
MFCVKVIFTAHTFMIKTGKYGYYTFEEFLKHTSEIAPEEIADIEFVSIVYAEKKLG